MNGGPGREVKDGSTVQTNTTRTPMNGGPGREVKDGLLYRHKTTGTPMKSV